MEKVRIVARLVALRKDLEQDSILSDNEHLLLLFSDVCKVLELDGLAYEAALGYKLARVMDRWKQARAWPVLKVPAALVAKAIVGSRVTELPTI